MQIFRLTDKIDHDEEIARVSDDAPSIKEDKSTPPTVVGQEECPAFMHILVYSMRDWIYTPHAIIVVIMVLVGGANDAHTNGEEDVLDYLQQNMRILDALSMVFCDRGIKFRRTVWKSKPPNPLYFPMTIPPKIGWSSW